MVALCEKISRRAAPDFGALFAACPNPYLILDRDLIIVAVNDAYCRTTMTKRNEILGRPLFDVFPDNPDDLASQGTSNLHKSLMRVMEYGRPNAIGYTEIRHPQAGV